MEEIHMNLERMITQCTADSERWFPDKQELPFLALCLGGEVGEIQNLLKKVERGSITIAEITDEEYMAHKNKSSLQEEIVDALIYLCNMMGVKEFKDVDWKAIWDGKRKFNEERFGHRAVY